MENQKRSNSKPHSLSEWANIAEIVGAVALIISLIYKEDGSEK